MGSVQEDGTLHVAVLYHGMKFDRHGKCRFIPEQTRIPHNAQVKTYAVAEHG